jgi:hypothetical protein
MVFSFLLLAVFRLAEPPAFADQEQDGAPRYDGMRRIA